MMLLAVSLFGRETTRSRLQTPPLDALERVRRSQCVRLGTIVGLRRMRHRDVWKDLTDDQLFEKWSDLARQLGLDKDHFLALFDAKDDWARVVQCTAVIEAALNHSFGMLFPEPVANVLRGMNLERRRDLAEELGWLSESYAAATRELARIRNKVVHKAEGFKFTFKEHLNVKKELNLFREGFEGVWPPLPDGSPDRDTAEKDPSLTITMAALLVTDNVLASATEAKANQGKAVSTP
jgi:hypothetical protein